MHRLFGAKKKEAPPPPSLDDAASSLGTRQKNIEEKIKELDGELRRYNAQLKTAKGPAATNIKKRAMETLKRKRMYEQQRDQISAQQFNVDQTNFAISTVKDSHVTITAMKEASKVLKAEHKKININEIEDVNDDLADMMEDMEEINEALGRSYMTPEGVDEEDLEAELAGLEDELEGEDLFAAEEEPAAPASLPAAPSNVPASALPTAPQAAPTVAAPAQRDAYGLPVKI